MNSTILKISLQISLVTEDFNDPNFCKTKLNGIFRVVMKAISWASGVELNYAKKRQRFLLRLQTFFFNFCHVFTFLTFFIFI